MARVRKAIIASDEMLPPIKAPVPLGALPESIRMSLTNLGSSGAVMH